ncbi:PREDICTED: transcription factor GTE6-like isoform X2 [Tarenaya hassleriana]|nr:PREDICTED: transcription factor GTE6-like isoform X2 [Tarenaya hassleriana]XP_010553404.1 PREDICTED: transcription factor GTE6-like isoform X2 [Tarenaya hassleriana]
MASPGSVVKEKGRYILYGRKVQQEATRREAEAAKRMQDLMHRFQTIFSEIRQHKWALPFRHPVDVEGLGLHDYYEIIDKPMDFSTIKNKMEAKDGTGYKHVMQIYADMRLVFENAMKYNAETSEVYSMAKRLLETFEGKWAHFLLEVKKEEKRQEEEKKLAESVLQLVNEASHAERSREVSDEICSVIAELEELRNKVVQKHRKISIQEKRDIGLLMPKLSADKLMKMLEILPNVQTTAEGVMDVEIDGLDEPTLWRLKFFVKEALKDQKDETGDHVRKDIQSETGADKSRGGINKRKKRNL